MADEITQKHFNRARVRGAPSTIPGSAGLIGTYDCEEVTRQTVRALALDLHPDFSVFDLRNGGERLQQLAAIQKLRALEQPLFALAGDPMVDLPREWKWQLLLPVRGPAKPDEASAVTVSRIHGGAYLETMTPRGFGDLRNLYTYFLGRFMPAHKQQLTRSLIYHRVLHNIEGDDPNKLSLAVYLPYYLSLKQPQKLLTREEM